MFLAKKISSRKVFPLKKKAALYADYEAKYQTIFLRPKFTALIFWEHLNVFGGGGIKEKMTGNTVPVWNAYFMLYLKVKSNVGSLPWHWKPCFPNPLKNKQEDFLTYFVLDATS